MLRLESHYNDNWVQIEGHHLTAAFQLQENKINSEWAVQQEQVQNEFKERRTLLQGYQTPAPIGSPKSPSNKSNQSPKWHDREKPRFGKELWTFEQNQAGKIAVFHGYPKPHQSEEKWVIDNWK